MSTSLFTKTVKDILNEVSLILKGGKEKEMFYLTTHSTLWLYGVRHMVKDHSDSERGNPLPPHRLLFPINSKDSFICTIRQDSTYHSLCYTSRGALAGTRNSSMGPPPLSCLIK